MLLTPSSKDYLILDSRDAGMFSVFIDVLSLLKYYDSNKCSGIEIDFENHGHYYSRKFGPNWWNYYFEPIKYGEASCIRRTTGLGWVWADEYDIPREEACYLANKYIRIKPDIQKEIDDFYRINFTGFYVIGVHYRGTDKKWEAPRIEYKKVSTELSQFILSRNLKDFKIFIATDEAGFINYLTQIYGDKKVCYLDCIRCPNNIGHNPGIHQNPKNDQYKCGKDALMDCILLSKTDFLIRCCSNLSLCSTFFNPKLEVLELNKKYSMGKKVMKSTPQPYNR